MRRLGLLLLLTIGAAGGFAGWFDHEIRHLYRGYSASQVFVDIPRGTSRWGIAALLQSNGVVHSRAAFLLLCYWQSHRHPQAGEYLFGHPMNPLQVFDKLASGQIYVHEVTVPEGWTMFDVAHELERQGICHSDDFLKVARDPSLIQDIMPQANSLEGFLFPSTYQFSRHTTPGQIAATMVNQFRTTWEAIEQSIGYARPEGMTRAQIVTMASLVERETPKTDERPLVAGVFYNRLNLGRPLQCDPTVQYARLLEGHPAENVRAEDLHVESPYNTYRHAGLPPGPIANPGEASLRAALTPAKTDYLYFVANDQGGHFFGRTLAEHNHNVARYRHLLAGDASPPEPPPHVAAKAHKHKHGRHS